MSRPIQKQVLIALMAGLTCIGGWIRIPFVPVPITLQTLFVYLAGSLLGAWPGCISQMLYLLIGLAGLPVFTSGGGPAYALHPTFGYLLGFPPAAWIIGRLMEQWKDGKPQTGRILLALASGMGLILGLGLIGLIVHTRWAAGKSLNIWHLVWTGGLIFVPGETAKMLLAAQLILRFRPLMERKTR